MQKEIIATDGYVPVDVKEGLSLGDLYKQIFNQAEEIPCDQCWYIDCVCTNERFELF
ncbi:MAG: hypothetical protein HQL12_09465 [Candidatus Omnitrophica bacterium]|nr:hypothetical protein [Candidatus Omnitrophota bacterium]